MPLSLSLIELEKILLINSTLQNIRQSPAIFSGNLMGTKVVGWRYAMLVDCVELWGKSG